MCERRTLPMPGTERGWAVATTSGNCLGRFLVRYSGSKQAGRQAGRQGFARSAIYSCALPRGSAAKLACQKKWIYIYIRRNKCQGEGHWPVPRAPYLRPSVQAHPPRRRPWNKLSQQRFCSCCFYSPPSVLVYTAAMRAHRLASGTSGL